MPKLKARQYEIIITDLKTLVEYTYTYSTYEEAINYYAAYKDACKGCKLTLYVLLLDEIIE